VSNVLGTEHMCTMINMYVCIVSVGFVCSFSTFKLVIDLLPCIGPPRNYVRESFKIFAEPPKQTMLEMLNA